VVRSFGLHEEYVQSRLVCREFLCQLAEREILGCLVVPKGNTIEALRNLRIATIKETSAEQTLFKEIGTNHGLNITRVSTPIQGYKMLEYGRIDALVYTDVPFV
jgi:ABC-type amino acid transport substrate-binding protein